MQIHVELRGPAAGALYREASILAVLDDGRRHAVFIAACRLGKFVAHDVSGHDQVEPASLAACDASGVGEKAPIEPPKMTLGPCRGGAVRPADPGDLVMVGEGIETCLAAMQAGYRPAWSALSTSGRRRVRIGRPPQAMDFNDVLPGSAPRTEEGTP